MPVDIENYTMRSAGATRSDGEYMMGLLEDSELRESLTMKPPENMRELMRRIKEYKRLEDDRQQSKGKAPIIS